MKRVVLLGGGLAHALALLGANAPEVRAELELSFISDARSKEYAGRRAALIAGTQGGLIDLARLAKQANAHAHWQRAVSVDLVNQIVFLEDGSRISYDLLSLNTGTSPDLSLLKGGEEHGHPLKPLASYLRSVDAFILRSNGGAAKTIEVTQIGAGPSGCEAAAALCSRLQRELRGCEIRLTVIEQGSRLLPHAPEAVARRFETLFRRYRARLMLETRAKEVRAGAVFIEGGVSVRSDFISIALSPRPEQWIQELPLTRADRGFLQVNAGLQTSDPNVFAAGGIARREGCAAETRRYGAAPREAEMLLNNWLAAARGLPLHGLRAPFFTLSFIEDGQGGASIFSNGLTLPSARLGGWLKARIDARFMRKFN